MANNQEYLKKQKMKLIMLNKRIKYQEQLKEEFWKEYLKAKSELDTLRGNAEALTRIVGNKLSIYSETIKPII